MSRIDSIYKNHLSHCDAQNLRRQLLPLEQNSARLIKFEGKSYVNFSSNDYLGLSGHPLLLQRAMDWAEQFGAGSRASRLVTGNLKHIDLLEKKIARWKGKEAALIMASGFQANAAVLAALFDKSVLGQTPLIYADRLNHASMHFGCKAAGVRQNRYRHLDCDHLEEKLIADSDVNNTGGAGPKFILTETIFSMDGDRADINKLALLAHEHEALLIADDAHGTGLFGAGGEGASSGADIVIGTFSKALGSFGAYIAASQTVIDYLIQSATGFIYSTGLPPMVLGAIDAALDRVADMDREREYVKGLADQFRSNMQAAGINTGASESQIVPVIVGEEHRAIELSNHLREKGYWVTAIRPPTVPKGSARLRIAFSALHSHDDMDGLSKAIVSAL